MLTHFVVAFFKLETSCFEMLGNIGILFSENVVVLNISREEHVLA